MDIGEAIKTLRQKQGWTQAELGEKCGMSTNAISSIETGKAWPPKNTVERLCQAFGVPASFLLMASIEESDLPEEKRVLYRALVQPLRNELLEVKDDDKDS